MLKGIQIWGVNWQEFEIMCGPSAMNCRTGALRGKEALSMTIIRWGGNFGNPSCTTQAENPAGLIEPSNQLTVSKSEAHQAPLTLRRFLAGPSRLPTGA